MYSGLKSANSENLPTAAAAAKNVLCLPIYPNLHDEDISKIVEIIKGEQR
jgi:dTDP-4-amino-4,6-dideoxygalactose transaminase